MWWIYSAIGIYLFIGLVRALGQISRSTWGAKGKLQTIVFVMLFWPLVLLRGK